MFEGIHQKLYKEFVPKLKKEYKGLFDSVKRKRDREDKKYNYNGAFFSCYLQNIENDILTIVRKYLCEKGYKIGALIFDSCLVEKNDNLANEFPELEKTIFEKTGYAIKIEIKSLETDWKPYNK